MNETEFVEEAVIMANGNIKLIDRGGIYFVVPRKLSTEG